MRHGAAQHHRVQHAFALEIVDEAARALEKAEILGPVDGLADQRPDIHGDAALQSAFNRLNGSPHPENIQAKDASTTTPGEGHP